MLVNLFYIYSSILFLILEFSLSSCNFSESFISSGISFCWHFFYQLIYFISLFNLILLYILESKLFQNELFLFYSELND